MSKVTKFKMEKGVTVEGKKAGESHWSRKNLTLVVEMPEKQSDEDLAVALTRAEYVLDSFLGTPEASPAAQIPNFDPEDLMKHVFKGKKTGEGIYENGSLAWGWDFRKNFKPETIQVLEKGPLEIGEYVFNMNDTIVNVKKKGNGGKKR